jgi:uncharacterized protein
MPNSIFRCNIVSEKACKLALQPLSLHAFYTIYRMNFQNKADRWLDRVLRWWASGTIRYPWFWILASVLLSGGSFYYTTQNLGVDMDSTKLLAADLPFQKDRVRLEKDFPQDLRCILVVVESSAPEQTHGAAKELGERLSAEKKQVQSVFIPGQGDFFERESLLFLETGQLEKVATALSQAQPFLGRLAANNSLSEFLFLIGEAIGGRKDDLALELDPLLAEMTTAIQALLQGAPQRISWQELMLPEASPLNKHRQLILVKPVFDYQTFVPTAQSVETVRRIVRDFEHSHPGIDVRLTGEVALEHEELASISRGMTIAGITSALLVCVALILGLGSVKLVVATLVTLAIGLFFAAGFATFAVGHLNVISVSFAVLYVGLGVDYAIHFCLHYKESISKNRPRNRAVVDSMRTVGPSIMLCTITTAIGFYAFVPTAYQGVAELGVIAGTAMFICCFITLTTLPAMLALIRLKPYERKERPPLLPDWVYDFPMRHAGAIKTGSVIVAVAGSVLLFDVTFDFSPINLRDPNSESVVAFRDLLREKESPLMTISVLAKDRASAQKKAAALNKLDVVIKVISIDSFIPGDQANKLAIIDDLAVVLGPDLASFPEPAQIRNPSASVKALKTLSEIIEAELKNRPLSARSETLERLDEQLRSLLIALETASPAARKVLIEQLQDSLLSTLPLTVQRLLAALEAAPVEGIDDLPDDLAKRWISSSGAFRLQVFPGKDLNDLANMSEFVSEVQRIEPHASDLPVQYLESGREVVRAFQQALFYAVIAISVISLLVLRNLKESVLILFLLGLVTVLTGAASVVFAIPFNFANIIALPLLLGLGVDSAIHIIHRLRTRPSEQTSILRTSTARGVFFSTLTTAFSFVTLAFIAHAGIASLGQLLTVGIVATLFCMLVVLPAFAVKKPTPAQSVVDAS